MDGASETEEYTYDAAGRVIEDKNKGMTFAYNTLGLPREAVFSAPGTTTRFATFKPGLFTGSA